MSARCGHAGVSPDHDNLRYRRILWIALAANLAMFFVELLASLISGSSSLAADALDFLGDSANYAVSLAAIAVGGLWVSRVALLKGIAMLGFGLAVLVYAGWRATLGVPPEPITMGVVAMAAFGVNLGVALLLYRFRNGDANMRSVWLCTRNDVIANLAVIAAAVGVFGTGSLWPDFAVAVVLAALATTSGRAVILQARGELRRDNDAPSVSPAGRH